MIWSELFDTLAEIQAQYVEGVWLGGHRVRNDRRLDVEGLQSVIHRSPPVLYTESEALGGRTQWAVMSKSEFKL